MVIGPPAPGRIYKMEAALGPRGSAAVAWTETDDGSSGRLLVAHREGGDWHAPYELGKGEVGGVAIDRDGVVTVAWAAAESSVDSVNWVVTVSRLVRGRWEPAQTLARHGLSPEVAVNRHGDVALVWATDQGVGVALRRRATGRWGPAAYIKGIRFSDDPHVAIDDRGRALAMWARSIEEESYARRHLAWARTRNDGSWTPARYLDERTRREVVGVELGLSMNPRGQAVAAWSPSSVDEGGVRVARFSFGKGWTAPKQVAEYAFEPSALMTGSGSAIVMLNFSTPPDWVFREPGSDWTVGGRVTSRNPFDAFGDGQRMAVLYRAGRNLTARFLFVPARPR